LINLPRERKGYKVSDKANQNVCSTKKDLCWVFSLLDIYDFGKLSLSYSIHVWTLGPWIN
jgi:hypothetical protein